MLLLGTFASAQYRDYGRGGSGYDLYRSAHSDIAEAMNMLNVLGRDDPQMRDLANKVSAVGSELGGAEVKFDQGRGGQVPPPDPIGGRGPYERALNLLDRAHRKIASANDRVRNPDALSLGTSAQNRLEQVLNELQSGDRRGGWERH